MKLNKLKGKRVEVGLSQEDLAKHLNVNPVTYQRKESGLREFSASEVFNLTKVLKLTLKDVNEIFFDNSLT